MSGRCSGPARPTTLKIRQLQAAMMAVLKKFVQVERVRLEGRSGHARRSPSAHLATPQRGDRHTLYFVRRPAVPWGVGRPFSSTRKPFFSIQRLRGLLLRCSEFYPGLHCHISRFQCPLPDRRAHDPVRRRAARRCEREGERCSAARLMDRVLSKNPIDAVRRADSTLDARRVATFVTAESLC